MITDEEINAINSQMYWQNRILGGTLDCDIAFDRLNSMLVVVSFLNALMKGLVDNRSRGPDRRSPDNAGMTGV